MISKGTKRNLASAIAASTIALPLLPGGEAYTGAVMEVAAAIGGAGVGHAVAKKTLKKNKVSTITSIAAIALVIAQHVPVLAPIVVPLTAIAQVLGATSIGLTLREKSK